MAAATVLTVKGEAFARNASGSMRRLTAGDTVEQGEVVITSAGGSAEILSADGQMLTVNSQESMSFGPESSQASAPGAGESAMVAGAATAQTIINAPGELNVEQLLEQEAAAAGLGAGGENGGNSFVRLLRVSENINPVGFEFPHPNGGEILPFNGIAAAQPDVVPSVTPPPTSETRTVDVEVALQGAGEDNKYSAAEIGDDGTVLALVTLPKALVGDLLVVTDGDGKMLFSGTVTQSMLDNGLELQVGVSQEGSVVVKANLTAAEDRSITDNDMDDKGVIYVQSEDHEPVAKDDSGDAMVIVTQNEEGFNGALRVMGAGEGADSFETRLGIEHNQNVWLLSDASFGKSGFEAAFTITDKGAGSDPAFVVTPNFMANDGDSFTFTATMGANFKADDLFSATVYQFDGSEWKAVDTLTGTDGNYQYTFADDGEYRVKFTVDDNTGGAGKASAMIDITSDEYFTTGGGETVILQNAEGNILDNDQLTGDGAHTWAFFGGVVDGGGDVTVVGKYGTLVIDSDGNYTYTPNGDSSGTDTFSYTLTDGDAVDPDSSSAMLTINVGMKITSTSGDDTLFGGAGNDELIGGAGSDTIVINLSDQQGDQVQVDTLTGFKSAEDTLQINDLLSSHATVTIDGANAKVVDITSDYGTHQLVFDSTDEASKVLANLQSQLPPA